MKRAATLVATLLLLALVGWWAFGADWWHEAQAREAIEAAVDACAVHPVVAAQKYVDAQSAIRKCPPIRQLELSVLLDNKLRIVLCR